jgi:hypothetical protein
LRVLHHFSSRPGVLNPFAPYLSLDAKFAIFVPLSRAEPVHQLAQLFPISGSALAAKKKAFFTKLKTSLIFFPSTSYGGYPRCSRMSNGPKSFRLLLASSESKSRAKSSPETGYSFAIPALYS